MKYEAVICDCDEGPSKAELEREKGKVMYSYNDLNALYRKMESFNKCGPWKVEIREAK